jgi:HD superfamily phosphohydrolase
MSEDTGRILGGFSPREIISALVASIIMGAMVWTATTLEDAAYKLQQNSFKIEDINRYGSDEGREFEQAQNKINEQVLRRLEELERQEAAIAEQVQETAKETSKWHTK